MRLRRASLRTVTLQPPRAGGLALRRAQSGRAGVVRTSDAASTSAASAGFLLDARHARPGERAAGRPCLDSSHGDPCDNQFVAASGAVEGRLGRAAEGMLASLRRRLAAAADLQISRMGRSRGHRSSRVSRAPRRVTSTTSFRSREASAISASATMHLARDSASRVP